MAKPLVRIEGIISAHRIVQPNNEKQKPYHEISILQLTDKGQYDARVKDYDLTSQYNQGHEFDSYCVATSWGFNDGRNGVTFLKTDAQLMNVSLTVELDVGKKSLKTVG